MDNVLDEVTVEQDNPFEYTTTTGVVLKIKRVSSLIIADAARRLKEPAVPKFFNEEKGREEDNPNDPDYLEAVSDFKYRQGLIMYGAYLAFGTEVISIPEGMPSVNDTEWSQDLLELTGLEIPEKGRTRYVSWLKYIASTENDIGDLIPKIMQASGAIAEREVKKAMDSFRSNEERNQTDGVSTTETPAN